MTDFSEATIADLNTTWPCDPKALVIQLEGNELGIVVQALGEIPAKHSRRLLEKIERLTKEQTMAVRRAYLDVQAKQDQERLQAAEDRRRERDAKRAKQKAATP